MFIFPMQISSFSPIFLACRPTTAFSTVLADLGKVLLTWQYKYMIVQCSMKCILSYKYKMICFMCVDNTHYKKMCLRIIHLKIVSWYKIQNTHLKYFFTFSFELLLFIQFFLKSCISICNIEKSIFCIVFSDILNITQVMSTCLYFYNSSQLWIWSYSWDNKYWKIYIVLLSHFTSLANSSDFHVSHANYIWHIENVLYVLRNAKLQVV